MFDFYNLCYQEEYLSLQDLQEACKWDVITKEEFKKITKVEFVTQ